MLIADTANLDAFRDLAAGVRRGALALVGAGCSKAVGYPLWNEWLDILAARAMAIWPELKPESLRDGGDSLWRAEELRRLLGPDEFEALVRKTFGPEEAEFGDLQKALVDLPFKHFLTTNYDASLERAAQVPRIDWANQSEVRDFLATLNDGRRRVVFLHGRFHKPADIVLTESDYSRRYRSGVGRSLLHILAAERLVALGFSMTDPYLAWLLRDSKAELGAGAPQHFALLPASSAQEAAPARRRLVGKYGTVPVFYRYDPSHSGLRAVLWKLTEDVTAEKRLVPLPSTLPQWSRMDADAIEGVASAASTEELERFFDGQTPSWRQALSTRVPRREIVETLVAESKENVEFGHVTAVLLIGPAGEGRTTALLQTAAELARETPAAVFWRPDRHAGIDLDALADLARSPGNVLLAADHADSLVDEIETLASRAKEWTSSVHLLLSARSTAWRLRRGNTKPWNMAFDRYREFPLRGITDSDAEAIAKAWTAASSEWSDPAGLKKRLATACRSFSPREEGAFLGGLLRLRYESRRLPEHLKNLLEDLRCVQLGSGWCLRDALIYIALLDAAGIDGLDLRVLADLFGLDHDLCRERVEAPLCDEAAGSPATQNSIRTRHRDIATAIIRLAALDLDYDLEGALNRTVKQTIATAESGVFIHPFSEIVHCGPRVLCSLEGIIGRKKAKKIAIGAAKVSAQLMAHQIGPTVTLGETLRSSREFARARTLFAESYRDGDLLARVDARSHYRGFLTEWGATLGEHGMHASSVYVLGCSLVDWPDIPTADRKRVKMSLASMGVSVGALCETDEEEWPYRFLSSIAFLLRRFSDGDETATGYAEKYSDAACSEGASPPSDYDSALLDLLATIERADANLSPDDREGLPRVATWKFTW